jgi:hypothetical protein
MAFKHMALSANAINVWASERSNVDLRGAMKHAGTMFLYMNCVKPSGSSFSPHNSTNFRRIEKHVFWAWN